MPWALLWLWGLEGWLLDFDDAAFYRQGDRRSTSGRQRRDAGRDHGAMVLGGGRWMRGPGRVMTTGPVQRC